MKKYLALAKEYAMITLGTGIIACAVYFFMMPSHVSVGSISGLAIILTNFIPMSVSSITMIMNVFLLILGFLAIGKEFGVKTVYTSILLPAMLGLLERLFPNFPSIMADPFLDMVCYIFVVSVGLAILTVYTSILLPAMLGLLERLFPNFPSIMADPFLDMVCYIFVVSVGLAILFNRNASSGGLDIVAKILNKYLHMELGKAMSLSGILVALSSALVYDKKFNRNASSGGLDIVAKILNKYLHMELGKAMSLSGILVALSSALVYDKKIVVLSLLGTYLNGIVVDRFIFGFNLKKRVCIISEKEAEIRQFIVKELHSGEKEAEIRQFIVKELHSGATVYEVLGAYNMKPRKEVITIVDKNEYLKLMNFIEKTDKDAFITIYDVNKIIYRPKSSISE